MLINGTLLVSYLPGELQAHAVKELFTANKKQPAFMGYLTRLCFRSSEFSLFGPHFIICFLLTDDLCPMFPDSCISNLAVHDKHEIILNKRILMTNAIEKVLNRGQCEQPKEGASKHKLHSSTSIQCEWSLTICL